MPFVIEFASVNLVPSVIYFFMERSGLILLATSLCKLTFPPVCPLPSSVGIGSLCFISGLQVPISRYTLEVLEQLRIQQCLWYMYLFQKNPLLSKEHTLVALCCYWETEQELRSACCYSIYWINFNCWCLPGTIKSKRSLRELMNLSMNQQAKCRGSFAYDYFQPYKFFASLI